MRTTLTLDDDVVALLTRLQKQRKSTFREIVNQALREGLRQMDAPLQISRKPYQIKPVSLGACRLGNLDNIGEVLAVAEGDAYR